MYATLLGLIAATGIRIPEALALQLDDMTADELVIRESKFRNTAKKWPWLIVLSSYRLPAGRCPIAHLPWPRARNEHLLVLAGNASAGSKNLIQDIMRPADKHGGGLRAQGRDQQL
jgi:integrase